MRITMNDGTSMVVGRVTTSTFPNSVYATQTSIEVKKKSLDEVKNIFTEENCSRIVVSSDGQEDIVLPALLTESIHYDIFDSGASVNVILVNANEANAGEANTEDANTEGANAEGVNTEDANIETIE